MVKIAELATDTTVREEFIIGRHKNRHISVGQQQRPTYRSYGVAYLDDNHRSAGSIVTLTVLDQDPPKAQVAPDSGFVISNLKGSAALKESHRVLKRHKIPRKIRKDILKGMKTMLETKDWLKNV